MKKTLIAAAANYTHSRITNRTMVYRGLDLFCGEGGASVGYARAGFTMEGVDNEPARARRYPYQAYLNDALAFASKWRDRYDFFVASPPCQLYSITNAARQDDYPDLIEPTRKLLNDIGKPWVIENVERAPLINPITLCWQMFVEPGSVIDDDGTPLRMERHRLFESNFRIPQPEHLAHDPEIQVAGAYGGAPRDKWVAKYIRKGGYVPRIPVLKELLGVTHMTQQGMFLSIPPSYTEYVGKYLTQELDRKA